MDLDGLNLLKFGSLGCRLFLLQVEQIYKMTTVLTQNGSFVIFFYYKVNKSVSIHIPLADKFSNIAQNN
jgi:hypothetical protein